MGFAIGRGMKWGWCGVLCLCAQMVWGQVSECEPGRDDAWMRIAENGLLGEWKWWRVEGLSAVPEVWISPVVVPRGTVAEGLRFALASVGSDIEVVSDVAVRGLELEAPVRVAGDLREVVAILGRMSSGTPVARWDPQARIVHLVSSSRFRLWSEDEDGLTLAAGVVRGVGVERVSYLQGNKIEFLATPAVLKRVARVLRALSVEAVRDPARQAAVLDIWLWGGLHEGMRGQLEQWWRESSVEATALWRAPDLWALSFVDESALRAGAGFPILGRAYVHRMVVPDGLAGAVRVLPCVGREAPVLGGGARRAPWVVVRYDGTRLWRGTRAAGELELNVALHEVAEGHTRAPGRRVAGLDVRAGPGGTLFVSWPEQEVAAWIRVGWRVSPSGENAS